MAIVVTFRLPKDVCSALIPGYGTPAIDASGIKNGAKRLIDTALKNKIAPVEFDIPASVQTERINLSLKDVDAKKIREIARILGTPDSIACQRLIMGLSSSPLPQSGNDATALSECEILKDAWNAANKSARIDQAHVYMNLKDALSDGQIALIEAATGVGKTLAMLVAAEERLRSIPDSRVVIATPTISLMQQFAKTHKELQENNFSIHPLRVVFGRREFVSKENLEDLIGNPKYIDHRQAIEAWINLNGEPMPDSAFAAHWLVGTLRQIAPGFPVEASALSDLAQETDPGYVAYLQQFEHNEHSGKEILLCTHAMLSVSTRMRYWAATRSDAYKTLRDREVDLMLSIKEEKNLSIKAALQENLRLVQTERLLTGAAESENSGKLPPFRYLMIDEAHQIEAAMSAANASYLSIHSLVQKAAACHAAGIGITASKLEAIRSAAEKIKNCASFSKGDSISLSDNSPASVMAKEAISEMLDACCVGRMKKKALSGQETFLLRQLDYSRAILKSACQQNLVSTRASVRFSPVKDFPQIYIGASRVDNLLKSLWASVKAAACVSATLFIPKKQGFSSSYQRKLLAIPEGRHKEYAPITPLWAYSSVAGVQMPSKKPMLCPPSRSQKLSGEQALAAEQEWLTGVSDTLAKIHEGAVGGTLVLMTSYDSIKKISKILSPEIRQISVFASLDATIQEQGIAFLKLANKKTRPIWFATGGAWTGLDIGGHEPMNNLLGLLPLPAENDNILTDLVIPRLPFGINRSVTHEYRIQTDPRTPWEILDMLFRLKQGVGRLIRRDELPHNRRIFLLDSRIYSNGFSYIHDQIDLIFRFYKKLI